MLLTLEKLQSHSEAEEGVSMGGRSKDRKKADLQTTAHTETTASTQGRHRDINIITRAAYAKITERHCQPPRRC